MSYELELLSNVIPTGTSTSASPYVIPFGVTPAESRNFVVAFQVAGVTGVGPLYATPTLETSWDGGITWVNVASVEKQVITGTGWFYLYATTAMEPVAPLCRAVVTVTAAHTITFGKIVKSRYAPGDFVGSAPPSATISTNTVTITGPFGQDLMLNSLPVAIASDQSSLPVTLNTRHETVTTPLAVRESDGTDFISSIALAAVQLVTATATKLKSVMAVMVGWDGTAHREISLSPAGNIKKAGLVTEDYLGLSIAYPDAVTEVITYYRDAAKTQLICTVTLVYADATKERLTSTVRT